MPESLLDACPRCRRRLAETAAVSISCPRCKLSFDRRLRLLWPKPRSAGRTLGQVGVLCGFMFLSCGLFCFFLCGPGPVPLVVRVIVAMVFIPVALACLWALYVTLSRPRVLVAATPEELFVCRNGKRFDSHAWSRVGEVWQEPLRARIVLMIDGESVAISEWWLAGSSLRGSSSLVEAINDYRRQRQADESGLMPRCPRCEYRLFGLPVEHRCPECGLMVDRRWRLIAPQPLRRFMSLGGVMMMCMSAAMGLAFVAIGVMGLTGRPPLTGIPPVLRILCLAPLAIGMLNVAAPVLTLLTSVLRPRVFLAATPRSLLLCLAGDCFTKYDWERLGPAVARKSRWNPVSGTLVLPVDGKPLRFPARWFSRGDPGQLEACVGVINELRKRAGPTADDPKNAAGQEPLRGDDCDAGRHGSDT